MLTGPGGCAGDCRHHDECGPVGGWCWGSCTGRGAILGWRQFWRVRECWGRRARSRLISPWCASHTSGANSGMLQLCVWKDQRVKKGSGGCPPSPQSCRGVQARRHCLLPPCDRFSACAYPLASPPITPPRNFTTRPRTSATSSFPSPAVRARRSKTGWRRQQLLRQHQRPPKTASSMTSTSLCCWLSRRSSRRRRR